MDVNGSRFSLILGQQDWLACREPGLPFHLENTEYQADRGMLSLKRALQLFRPEQPSSPLTPDQRRGAGSDRFGNWYWIGEDNQTLYWAPSRGTPRVFWDQAPEDCPEDPGDGFQAVDPHTPAPDTLAGLAVTDHHYLVVGNVTRHGLLVFDLYAGGPPLLLGFPAEIDFAPFDLAPAPHAGVWVMDRQHRAYWGLDRYFRSISDAASLQDIDPEQTLDFRPVDGDAVVIPAQSFPRGFAVAAVDPVSIEGLSDGSVLILDTDVPAGSISSSVLRYRLQDQLGGAVRLEDELRVEISSLQVEQRLGVAAHDIAYVPAKDASGTGYGDLYAVDVAGKQVIAFHLTYDATSLSLAGRVDYLPLHFYGARALASGPADCGRGVFYDLDRNHSDAKTRWVQLRATEQPRYVTSAQLLLGTANRRLDQPPFLDSGERDTVWHRLFLDTCIPPETSVSVSTRAANNLEDLESLPFLDEPIPYQRNSGAEVPYFDPFPGLDAAAESRRDFGTFETLLQAAKGRYIQVRLTLRGNGKASPYLRAVRVYYPRFSYLKRYLPAVYQEEPESANFTERLLANMEGFNTEIEGQITEAYRLFDARTATPEALDWLAGWLGLVLDPLWGRIQSRRHGTSASCAPGMISVFERPQDRRRLFIRFARKLYERRGTVKGIQFALHLLLDPCLEETLEAFKLAACGLNPAVRDELRRLELAYPTSVMDDAAFEDLLYDYVLAPGRSSKVRLVESYQARDGRALALGDVSQAGITASTSIAGSAHRFTVLVPENLLAEEAAMVDRVIELEKPAHTSYSVARYYDYFRVGEARLGTDSVLGEGSRFVAMVLDRDYLNQGYLNPNPPVDTTERSIADRDGIGLRPL